MIVEFLAILFEEKIYGSLAVEDEIN